MAGLCFGLLKVLALLGAGVGLGWWITSRRLRDEYDAKDADLLEREQVIAHRDGEVQQAAQDVEASREWLARRMAALNAGMALLRRGNPPDTSVQGVSDYIRANYRQGALVGEHLRVMYLLSTDGFITFLWEVAWERPYDPMIKITRGGSIIRTDWGRNGEHKDHVQVGGSYHYEFTVHDGSNRNAAMGPPLVAVLTFPSNDVWNGKAPGAAAKRQRPGHLERRMLEEKVGAFVAAERAASKLRQEAEKVLRKQGLPEEEFEGRMSRLDGRIAEIRDEIGA